MRKLIAILLTAVLLLTISVGCTNTNDSKTVVRVNEVTHSIFYTPFYLAIELGYFLAEGIEIELTNGGGSNVSMTAVLSNQADVALVGPETAVFVYNEGREDYPLVFAQLTKRDGSFLVAREKDTSFDYSKLEGKEILAGRRGGMPAMTLEYVLNNHGLYNGVNVTLNYDVAFNMMAGAFEGGTADYTTLFEPTASDFESAKKGYVVASIGEDSGEIPYTCFVASKSFIGDNEELLVSFCRALYRAIDFIKNNPSSVVAEKVAPQFASTSKETIAKTVERHLEIDAWMTNLAMTEDSFIRLQDVMANANELTKRAEYTKLIYNDIAEKAYAELLN